MFFDILILIFRMLLSIPKSIYRKIVPPSKKSVHGEVALITGAGHGMGRLYALRFAALGAKVVIVDVNEAGNLETAEMVKNSGFPVRSYTCDLSKKDDIKRLARTVKKEVGDVDILVNNAGVLFSADFVSISDEMITKTYDVNVMSHFWLIREFLPVMKKKNHGHILSMASYSAKEPTPYLVNYASSKCAVVGLMEGLRRELRWLGLSGIKTTYINPMFVNTGFAKNPTTRSSIFAPILEPELVVDQAMQAFLTDQPSVDVPSLGIFDTLISVLPDEARELLFDFTRPTCDQLHPSKTD